MRREPAAHDGREPAAYQPTVHFGQRLRERVPENHRDSLVRGCLQRGRCHGLGDSRAKEGS
ncbi:MAG: hypothetical protein V5A39_13490 [Haloarculaceae archaeon]